MLQGLRIEGRTFISRTGPSVFQKSIAGRRHAMASNAAKADCLNPGAFWDGEAKGKVTKVAGMDAYLSQPAEPSSKAVVLLPDVFGWEAKNTRLLADKFAASGFSAILPDLFLGEKCPVEEMGKEQKPNFEAWRKKHTPEGAVSDTEKVIAELKSGYQAKTIGAIGFCWGGTLALHLATGDKIEAAVMNHAGGAPEETVNAVRQPLMVNGSDNDERIPKDLLDKVEQILNGKADVPSDVKVVNAHERATAWFQKHL